MKKFISVILAVALILSMASSVFAAETVEYIVQNGDSLSGIASKYNTTVKAIMDLNPSITNADKIKVGDKLVIPVVQVVDDGYVHHKVKAGDTLSEIAATYKTTVEVLKALNGLSNEDFIREGQDLIVGLKSGETPVIPNTPDTPDTPDTPNTPSTPTTPTVPALTVTSHEFFGDSISVNFKNADLGDVLNTVAQLCGVQIVYIGQAQTVTVKASGTVSSVVDSICKAGKDLAFIVSSQNHFVVGDKDVVSTSSSFAYKEATKIVTLKNIKAENLVAILKYLNIPGYTYELSTSDSMKLALTATPYGLALLLPVVNTIDRAENIVDGSFSWSKLTLANLTVAEFAQYAQYVGLGANVIADNTEGAVFVCGDKKTLADLDKLAKLVDVAASVSIYRYNLDGTSTNATALLTKYDASDIKTSAASAFTKADADGTEMFLVGTGTDINTLYSALEYLRTK